MKRALLAVALAACSSDVDLTGTYLVNGDVSSSPCGNDQAVAMAPGYVKFAKENVFGTDIFTYQTCADAAATNCQSTGLFGGFSEPIDGGWRGIASSSSPSSGGCYLGYTERTAKLSGKALVIEETQYTDLVQLTSDKCTTDEAEKRGKSMPCMMHERIDATKL